MSFKIVVVAGPQGCGKTTFINKNKRKNDVVVSELTFAKIKTEIKDLKIVRKILKAAGIEKVSKGRTVWLETQADDSVFLEKYAKTADAVFLGIRDKNFIYADFYEYFIDGLHN